MLCLLCRQKPPCSARVGDGPLVGHLFRLSSRELENYSKLFSKKKKLFSIGLTEMKVSDILHNGLRASDDSGGRWSLLWLQLRRKGAAYSTVGVSERKAQAQNIDCPVSFHQIYRLWASSTSNMVNNQMLRKGDQRFLCLPGCLVCAPSREFRVLNLKSQKRECSLIFLTEEHCSSPVPALKNKIKINIMFNVTNI